jgi:NAD-dependent protein deacetylase/lipoamidase
MTLENLKDAPVEIPSSLVEALRRARHVVVLTGAGISAESGIPTFRDAMTGLWARYRPEDLATPEAFRRDPRRVWEWYEWRRELVARARPNPGHLALVELARRVPRMDLFTQNVDGLHQRAGSREVFELHGNITRDRCFDRGHPAGPRAPDGEAPPRCGICGSYLRPDVVWFGERLPERELETAWKSAERCDLFISVGTSGAVQPVASLVDLAHFGGATVVIVNPDESVFTAPGHILLQGPSGRILPSLVEETWPGRRSSP